MLRVEKYVVPTSSSKLRHEILDATETEGEDQAYRLHVQSFLVSGKEQKILGITSNSTWLLVNYAYKAKALDKPNHL